MEEVVDFFMHRLLPSPSFSSVEPVDDQALVLPSFMGRLKVCVSQYRQKHPEQDITFSETYRSNTLQLKYFKSGASKAQKNGMHHYGIAVDSVFILLILI